jgi:hypothetical protein
MTEHVQRPAPEAWRRPDWIHRLPRESQRLLGEIYDSLDNGSRALPAMGIRALIDLVALSTVGDVGSFPQKLEALEQHGSISKVDKELLAVVIDAGSAASHRALFLEAPQLRHMMDCVEHLLWRLFASKALTQALREVIPKRGRRGP